MRGSTASRSGSPALTRASTALIGPVPNGGVPLAANAVVAAQPHQSVAAVTSSPPTTSGAR